LNKKTTIFISILFIIIYVLPLNVRPLVIPDETRYAEIGREMVATGDWIVPRLDGLLYFEKPVLGHWLHALGIKVLGGNAFAVRLPCALSAGVSALILYLLVLRFIGGAPTAIAAASIFLTCLEIFAIGTFSVLDSIFSMLVTAAMAAFFFAFMETMPIKRTLFLASAGIACGMAFLAKGFLAFAIPAIVIVPFAIRQRSLKQILCMSWIPLAVAILTALPWSIMIQLKEPDFWRYFFWVEHVDRFLSPAGGQHPQPFWFFLPVILAGTVPWTGEIAAAIFKLRTARLNDPLFRFAVCWFIIPFVFFSICKGKLVTYILPCYPPLVVLFIYGLQEEWKTNITERLDRSLKNGMILIIVLLAGLVIIIPATKIYLSEERWKLVPIAIALAVYAIVLAQAGKAANYTKKILTLCLGPLLLMFIIPFVIPEKLIEQKAPTDFISRYKDRISQNTVLVCDNYLAPAVCWCYKRTDVNLIDRAGEFAYGLSVNEATKSRLLSIKQFKELIAGNLNEKSVVLITSDKRYDEYSRQFPKPVFKESYGNFVFAQFATIK
jgi:4-amino-4-deoxy-L-arabinose transferase